MLKILFINNFAWPDYLSNMLYIGLDSRKDVELYTYAAPYFLINGIGWNDKFVNNSKWEGENKPPGFTVYNKVTKGPYIDFYEDIRVKIASKFYDKVIYSSVWRDRCFIDDVSKVYNKKDIIFIDGDDHELIQDYYIDKGFYFKREIYSDSKVLPISFAIPDSILREELAPKTQFFGTVFPGDTNTYIFKNEEEYFNDYYKSYYGVTCKKGGWDCLRHYEILANRSIPYFLDLKDCPKNTLHNFPKDIILYTNEYAKNNTIPPDYFKVQEELYYYTKANLTTSKLAQYVIENAQ